MGKPVLRKCNTKYCRNKSFKKHCQKCYSKFWREKNPVLYCYLTVKNNAKRRKKFFSLTFEEFKEFCIETKYMDKKGRTRNKYTIDRIVNELGYIRANIRCIKQIDNSRKQDLPF
jgi:hypothetical protein